MSTPAFESKLTTEPNRLVRVRLNASGHRLIGFVKLDTDSDRISDVLNSSQQYLIVWRNLECTSFEAVQKYRISYLEALEEPMRTALKLTGNKLSVSVYLHDIDVRISGEVFVPEGETIENVLNDGRKFLSVSKAEVEDSVEKYGFIAVSKRNSSVVFSE